MFVGFFFTKFGNGVTPNTTLYFVMKSLNYPFDRNDLVFATVYNSHERTTTNRSLV